MKIHSYRHPVVAKVAEHTGSMVARAGGRCDASVLRGLVGFSAAGGGGLSCRLSRRGVM